MGKQTDLPETSVACSNWRQKVFDGYSATLSSLPRFFSALMGLWIIGYFIGRKRATSYFDSVGGEWIASELSPSQLLALSFWPVVALIVGILFTFLDLSARPFGKGWRKYTLVLAVTLLVPLATEMWFQMHDNFAAASEMAHASVLTVASIVGADLAVWILRRSTAAWRVPGNPDNLIEGISRN